MRGFQKSFTYEWLMSCVLYALTKGNTELLITPASLFINYPTRLLYNYEHVMVFIINTFNPISIPITI